MSSQVSADVVVFENQADYDAATGPQVFLINFSGSTGLLVSGDSFSPAVNFGSPEASDPSQVLWSSDAITDAGSDIALNNVGPVDGVFTDPVYFYFAWDKDNLYIAAKCMETKMDSIRANAKEHDGAVYGEDCVGYFFQPETDDGPAFQIYFNPLGTAFDQKIGIVPHFEIG